MSSSHDMVPAPSVRRAALPIPGQARVVGDRLAPMLQAARLDDLVTATVRAAEDLVTSSRGFIVLADPVTAALDIVSARPGRGSAPRTVVLREILDEPSVAGHLAQGLHVRRALEGSHESWLVLPLVADARLHGALVLSFTPPDGLPPRTLELLRDLCRHAAPLLARLREIEELRHLVVGLTTLAHQGAVCEAQLQACQETVRELRITCTMRNALMANINHALRTPLVAIRGYARLLQQARGTLGSSVQRQHVETIARNAERLVDVARNLWTPPPVALRVSPIELRKLWEEAVEPLRDRAASRMLRLIERLPEQPVLLVADAVRLKQMLADLTNAAISMSHAGHVLQGEISDTPARVTITLESGPSVAGAVEPMGVEDGCATDAGRWLDAARSAANLHGGSVTALCGGERGLRFTVVLPRLSIED